MVYVISIDGKALMPTSNAKARILLKNKKAKVKNLYPFTIILLYETTKYIQEIVLGIDSGYMNVGFSALTDKKELISGELKLLTGMSKRISDRRMYRIIRRNKLRYRKPRFNNRTKSKPKDWVAPSIQHKLDSHIKFISKLHEILPISKIVVEVANFDIQKIKNLEIEGIGYQHGEQYGFYNLREYILHRDNHECQNPNCTNKDKSTILEIHHIRYKSLGGTDVPNNLIALCTKCHTSVNHKSGKFLYDWCQNGKTVRGFKDATFMSIVRWRLYNTLKEQYNTVTMTYGYITKRNRIDIGLEKTHYNDAFCIAHGKNQVRNSKIYYVKQVRRNNRSLEKFYDAKYIDARTGEKVSGGILNNGRRTRNKNLNSENLHIYRSEKISNGRRSIRRCRYFYQPNDLVKYDRKIYRVKGTSSYGKYISLHGLNYNPKVELIEPYKFSNGMIWN